MSALVCMRRITFKVDDHQGVRWEPGYFHMFAVNSYYGDRDEAMHYPIAIIEDENGNVHEVRPREICFEEPPQGGKQ